MEEGRPRSTDPGHWPCPVCDLSAIALRALCPMTRQLRNSDRTYVLEPGVGDIQPPGAYKGHKISGSGPAKATAVGTQKSVNLQQAELTELFMYDLRITSSISTWPLADRKVSHAYALPILCLSTSREKPAWHSATGEAYTEGRKGTWWLWLQVHRPLCPGEQPHCHWVSSSTIDFHDDHWWVYPALTWVSLSPGRSFGFCPFL